MTDKTKFQLDRRQLVAGTAAVAATTALGMPHIARAADAIKIGLIHPVTGFLQFSGSQCRFGAQLAIDEINKNGGIKSMGGAMLEAVLGDAQSKAEIGAQEVTKMQEAGVAAIVGAYSSGISTATTQEAAKHGIPHVVDVGVSDKIVSRGLTNTFRFGPGFGVIAKQGVKSLIELNKAAGNPVKTVAIVHENSTPFGTGIAKLMTNGLKDAGFEIIETLGHPSPNRDFSNIVLKLKAANADLVIPSNYYNEYVLLARTMQRQRVSPKAIYSVLGGAASQYKFLKEFPEAAQYIMDCNHWFNPKNPKALEVRQATRDGGKFFNYEVFLAYTAMMFVADAMERAGSADRAKITEALASSTWDGHIMPYGPTKIENGQNTGARPLNTQIIGKEIEVIAPAEYATAKAAFPRPA
ncbi:MAG: ABC transporter substrate-binding protein [Hyphomicrobiales bacterium]|nr:ABC transporter substrate-binding protein [Hyphomicrobiales bacterium]